MRAKYQNTLLSLFLFAVSPAFAAPLYQIEGQKQVNITTNTPIQIENSAAMAGTAGVASLKADKPRQKTIRLMKIKLSEAAKKQIREKANYQFNQLHKSDSVFTKSKSNSSELPAKINISMGNVPVLDQGAHGSCVTFATTTAIDAAYYNDDYVSQLCSLSLGSYLSKQTGNFFESWRDVLRVDLLELLKNAINAGELEYPSGWDGSMNELVLAQIKKYGVVSKTFQAKHGCGGLTQYPGSNPHATGGEFAVQEYQKVSERVLDTMTVNEFMKAKISENAISDAEQGLNQLKLALTQGQHISFGTILDTYVGGVGALGSYHAPNDTWVLTKQIKDHIDANVEFDAGHAMVIYGYDDDAEVIEKDKVNNKEIHHKGILLIRNSWGTDVGDHGEYYMTYDYFKTFVDEAAGLAKKR